MWLRRIVISLLSLVVVLLLAIGFIGFTRAGTDLALKLADPFLNSEDQKISISGAGPLLTGRLRIDRITVADAKGVYATVDGLAVDWSPSSLLALKLEIDRAAAQRVDVRRAPVSTKQSSSQSSSSLPVSIDLKQLSLPEILLGSELVGQEERLAADASLKIGRDGLSCNATVKDLGNTSASANFAGRYDAASQTLMLDAKAEEPRGGVIASLLNLPDKPALAFAIKGNGPLANWQGKAAASVEGVPVVDLDTVIRKSEAGPFDVSIKGGGAFDAVLPPVMEPLFKGKTQIDLAVSADPAGTLTVSRGGISTGTLTADLGGTLSLKGANDFRAHVTPVGDSAVFTLPLGKETVGLDLRSLQATVSGSADKAKIDAALDLKSLTADQGTLRGVQLTAHSDAFDLQAPSGTIGTVLNIGSSTFKQNDLNRLLRAPLKLTAPVVVTPKTVAADYRLESASLGGHGKVAYDLADGALDAEVNMFAAPGALPETLASRLTDTVGLSGKITLSNGEIVAKDIALKSQFLDAKGRASLKDGAIDAALDGTLPDIALLSKSAKGKGSFSLSAGGTVDEPSVKVALSVPKAVLSGKELDDFRADVAASLKNGAIAGDVKATGSIAGQKINVDAVMKQADGGTAIPDLQVRVGPNRIAGALTLDADFTPQGKLSFNLPDLSLLGAMAAQPLSGGVTGDVSLSLPEGQLAARVDLSGDRVRYDTIDLAGIKVGIDYRKSGLSGDARVATIKSGSNALDALALTFNQNGTKTNFGLDGRYQGEPLAVSGSMAPSGDKTVVQLDRASATLQRIPIRLSGPTALTLVDGGVRVDGLKLQLGNGSVSISGVAGSALDLRVAISDLPANLANQFSPGLGADGAISGTATVTGRASDPSAQFSLTWPSASLAATRGSGLPPFALRAKGNYGGGSLSLDASASGSGLNANASGKVNLAGAGGLAMRVTGSAPLSLAQPLAAANGLAVGGQATFDISANGALTAPRLVGSIKLASGTAVLPRQNLNLNGINGTITLDGNQARISDLTAKVVSGGTLSVGGTIGIAPGSGYPADLTIKLVKAVYSDGSVVNAKLDGDLSLKGPLTGNAQLGGTIRIAEAAITIPEKIPASLAELNIKHENAPPNVVLQAKELRADEPADGASGSSSIGLALDVIAPNQIFVRGRGVDAELGGTLRVTGSAASPSVSGGFNMIRGRLTILGRRLDFTSGTIEFGGNLVPTLDLKAATSSSALSITVTVSGMASDPSIGFTSSPARPQDEVLAQLIFDRSLSSLSPLQIAQLADAVLQLAGGRSTSIFEKLRKGTGIDDLDVSTDSSGQAQVTAGKYINNRTYLQLQQGATSGSTKAIINLDVGKGLKLRGEAGSDGGGAAGIFYEKEY